VGTASGALDVGGVAFGWAVLVFVVAAVLRAALNLAEGVMGEMTPERAAAVKAGRLEEHISTGNWIPTVAVGRSILHSVEIGAAAVLGAAVFGGVGTLVGVILQTGFAAVFESLARRSGARNADTLARVVAVGLGAAVTILPVWRLSRGRRNSSLNRQDNGDVEVEELRNVVDAARVEEVIDGEEHRIITSAMVLGDLMVKDIMVPWVEVVEVEPDSTVGEAVEVLVAHQLSRAPVVTERAVYVVNLKDLLTLERAGSGAAIAIAGARECQVVPGTKPVAKMMREMQADRQHLAAVADEYGELCGIVALEDCLEELVGEIEDEHDRGEAGIRLVKERTWEVNGSVQLRELRKTLGTDFVAVREGTIGGYIFDQLGRAVAVGDVVEVEAWRIEVLENLRRRIVKVRIQRI
jgi:CBS domain containing-hemolysin-like protein